MRKNAQRTSENAAQHGVSLVELLLVLTMIGLTVTLAAVSWRNGRGRTLAASAARTTQAMIHRARMDAVYGGINRFVVLDPAGKKVDIYVDSGTNEGEFDAADPWVAGATFDSSIDISLPTSPAPLPHPLESGSIAGAWSMPSPDTADRWGTDLLGFILTPRGLVESAAATPQLITSGAIVMSDARNHAATVVIRGRVGTVRSFAMREGQWKEL